MSIVTSLDPVDNLVAGGVDTHSDFHVAAVIDQIGRELGHASFPTTTTGYNDLGEWLNSHGTVITVGIEGTGVYGAGLTRALIKDGVAVVEVDRPDRKARRFNGKSDPIDAYSAARSALSGRASGTPKSRDGNVEMIRTLRVARSSAVKAKTMAINQLKAVITAAPEQLRANLAGLTRTELIGRCAGFRPARQNSSGAKPGRLVDVTAATKAALACLARRIQNLNQEIVALDTDLEVLVSETAPTLFNLFGVGTEVAGQLLVTVGDNPDRIHSSAAFAHLCGAAPIPASSGRTQNRHRLNRSGDRQANCALHRIVLTRLCHETRTQQRRDQLQAKGKTNKEITRILKRAVARDVYQAIKNDLNPPQTRT